MQKDKFKSVEIWNIKNDICNNKCYLKNMYTAIWTYRKMVLTQNSCFYSQENNPAGLYLIFIEKAYVWIGNN